MSKVSDIDFVTRQLDPDWNVRAAMAKKIRDFLDVPTHGPAFRRRLTEAERIVEKYKEQVQALRAHCNARYMLALMQAGYVP